MYIYIYICIYIYIEIYINTICYVLAAALCINLNKWLISNVYFAQKFYNKEGVLKMKFFGSSRKSCH